MICSCGLESGQKCKELFEAILAKEFSDYRYGKIHRLTVDAYCLQHPDVYMVSAKSFAAHLVGMYCAMKYDGDADLLKDLQKWLNGKKQLVKPAMLKEFGDLTISHLAVAKDADDHSKLVKEWAESAWESYAVYHDLAKDWIEKAQNKQQNSSYI
jgi:Family of unknown function (DUF5946)